MGACVALVKATGRLHRATPAAVAFLALPILVGACQPEAETAAPAARPVRTVTVAKREAGVPVTLTGRIEAEDEVALAFRIAGRVLENDRKLGDRLEAG